MISVPKLYGSWKDEKIILKRNIILKDSNNCYFRSENRLVVGIGINNLVVIETNDAILILDNEKSQEVKYIVQDLKKEVEGEHRKYKRQLWGFYNSLVNENWKVKLMKSSQRRVYLQMRRYRSNIG